MGDRSPDDVVNPQLTDTEIAALVPHGRRRMLGDGESLFKAGDQRGGFYIVLAGAIQVVDHSGDDAQTIAMHGPGQFTGDIDIIARRRPVVDAVARGETTVLGVSSADIRRIIAERPRIGETILRAFIARREALLESGFQGVRVIGSGESREAFRIREFLSRNQVPFTWIDVAGDPRTADLLRDFGIVEKDLPVVAAGSSPFIRNPSVRDLAESLGIWRAPRAETYDLVIVGGGPAGLAAAVYAASEGLSTLVLEATAPGGQAGASTKIENYLGFPTGITGAELTGRATLQAHKFGVELISPARVTGLTLGDGDASVELDSGERATARCVLVATGAEYRRLAVPGREHFDGMGVYYAATPTELTACRGSDVVVVGGGNSAGQAVMFLADNTTRVWVVLRSGDLRKSMSRYLADRIEAADNVEVLRNTEVRQILGTHRLTGVRVENTRGESRTIETPAVFSFIGAVPHTDWLPKQIEKDSRGFIMTGRAVASSGHWRMEREPALLETSHRGVFAAGDVRLGSLPRVSSAVGEGAMAVKFVHAYLAESGE
jgi:thioredoxin reductase (NADPH)